jgi:hypothetical protein
MFAHPDIKTDITNNAKNLFILLPFEIMSQFQNASFSEVLKRASLLFLLVLFKNPSYHLNIPVFTDTPPSAFLLKHYLKQPSLSEQLLSGQHVINLVHSNGYYSEHQMGEYLLMSLHSHIVPAIVVLETLSYNLN